jgi:hypothetical protein
MRQFTNRVTGRHVLFSGSPSTVEYFGGFRLGNLHNVGRHTEEPVKNLNTNDKKRIQACHQKICLETAGLVQQKNKKGQMNITR